MMNTSDTLFHTFKLVCDNKYYVVDSINPNVISVHGNEWARRFTDCGISLSTVDLYDDPNALVDAIRAYKSESKYYSMIDCDSSYLVLPWRRFLGSEFDNFIIPSHTTRYDLIERTDMSDRILNAVDTRMK